MSNNETTLQAPETRAPEAELQPISTDQVRQTLDAIKELQKSIMIKDQDYGKLPGTSTHSLFKSGAEKLSFAFRLTPELEQVDKREDWENGFFFYRYRCRVRSQNGRLLAEAVRSCNTMEDKYRWRWVFGSEVPEGMDKESLKKRWVRLKGQDKHVPQYRIPNEDTWSLVNVIDAMAQKRAMVAAVLRAMGASAIFSEEEPQEETSS